MPQKIGVCAKCRGLMPLTTHHIVPRCRGGNNERANLVLVCRPCHDELDTAIGVRNPRGTTLLGSKERKRRGERNRCLTCGNQIAKKLIGVSNLCQRHKWAAERLEYHRQRSGA